MSLHIGQLTFNGYKGDAVFDPASSAGSWINSDKIEIVWRDRYATSGYSCASIMPDGKSGHTAQMKLTADLPGDRHVLVKRMGDSEGPTARSLAEFYSLVLMPVLVRGYDGDIVKAATIIDRCERLLAKMPNRLDNDGIISPIGLILSAAALPSPRLTITAPQKLDLEQHEYDRIQLVNLIEAEWNAGNEQAKREAEKAREFK